MCLCILLVLDSMRSLSQSITQYGSADAVLTDNCHMRVCSRNMRKAKCMSFGGPSNSLRSLQHEDAWRGCRNRSLVAVVVATAAYPAST